LERRLRKKITKLKELRAADKEQLAQLATDVENLVRVVNQLWKTGNSANSWPRQAPSFDCYLPSPSLRDGDRTPPRSAGAGLRRVNPLPP
jgi:hypothetical protein